MNTTCTDCGKLYEAGSEEQAYEPERWCPSCFARRKFAELYATFKKHTESWPPKDLQELQDKLDNKIVEEARKLPECKRKPSLKRARKLLGKQKIDEITKPFEDTVSKMYDIWNNRKESIDEELCTLAQKSTLRITDDRKDLLLYRSAWDWTYHTQGFGAKRYAEQSAESQADKARCNNVPVEVRRVEKNKFGDLSGWHVMVWLETEIDLEILKRKEGPDLKEWIRLCWKRGVNPRVYNPFLPVGLEEKLRLDYFGNEVS